MLPAASDDFPQQARFPDDNPSPPQYQPREIPEHETAGKSKKKGKNGPKGKDKGAKATAQSPPEDLYACFSRGSMFKCRSLT